MAIITFSGSSDDIVVLSIDGKTVDEIDILPWQTEGSPLTCRIPVDTPTGGDGVFVYPLWFSGWAFAVMPIGEEPPAWSVAYRVAENGYAYEVTINTGMDEAVVASPKAASR